MAFSRARPKLGKVKLYSTRQKRRRSRASPRQIVALRLLDFARLFRSRYGMSGQLPDDDSGRDDLEPVLHHLASRPQPVRQCDQWLELWAPWLTMKERHDLLSDAILHARPWTADQLAWRYRVTREEREALGLTTIGAIDYGKAARTKRRRERDRQRKRAVRRAHGMQPRTEYEAASLTHAKPWEGEGISRRTWYRHRAAQVATDGTGPATP
jgi:hypothetical protein